MPRNDGVLNTGMSSAIERKQAERTKRLRAARDDRRKALTPGGEIIKVWIDQEIADAANLLKIIVNITDEDHVKAQLLGRQYYIESLQRLKNKANNVLREVKRVEKEAANTEKSEAQAAFEAEAAKK